MAALHALVPLARGEARVEVLRLAAPPLDGGRRFV